MARTAGQLISKLVNKLGRAARAQARPQVPSTTLRNAMRIIVEGNTAIVFIPHYWALYVHDGRGAIDFRNRRGFMVFFKDPSDDPRTGSGSSFAVRATQIRHLTKQQFAEFTALNTLRKQRGLDPVMIVTKFVRPTPPKPFFTEGLKTFPAQASKIIVPEFDAWIQSQVVAEQDVAVAQLG